jgi:hypothetical protein
MLIKIFHWHETMKYIKNVSFLKQENSLIDTKAICLSSIMKYYQWSLELVNQQIEHTMPVKITGKKKFSRNRLMELVCE